MTKKRIGIYVGVALLPVLVGGLLALWDVWRESTYFVSSKDAQVAAQVFNVAAPVAGLVMDYRVRVGDAVQPGDLLALLNVAAPVQVATGGAASAVAVPNRFSVNVRASTAGTVLSTASALGASVTAGQMLATIGDLDNVWVIANVDESRILKVRPGQPVEVHIAALDLSLPGEVAEITPATAAVVNTVGTAQVRPATTGSGTSSAASRGPQSVPVRIALEWSADDAMRAALYPGMSADVRIDVR